MDLRVYVRVIRRFWPLVSAGAAIAVLLAFFSFFRVGVNGGLHVSVRQHKSWKSAETLLLTQHGFPWGRTVYPYAVNKKTGQLLPSTSLADPSRFTDLAVVYAEVANGDAIRAQVFPNGTPDGSYSASPLVNSVGSAVLGAQPITQIVPLVQIEGVAEVPARARGIATRASNALRSYVEQSQVRAEIPPNQRVLLQVLSAASKPTLARGYRLTGPIVIFLGILVATLLLAFLLENLRPRRRDPIELDEREPPATEPWAVREPALGWAGKGRSHLSAEAYAALPLGRRLREERARRGLDLRVAAARVELPTKYLRAVEADRPDLLPDQQTARRVVEAYAAYLDVDAGPEFARVAAKNGARHNGRVKALSLLVPLVVAVVGTAVLLRGGLGSHHPGAAFAARSAAPAVRDLAAARPAPRTVPARPVTARVDVTAARGDSWLVVRTGSSRGRIVFAGTLRRGQTLHRRGARLWLELGAASNVDVALDGAPVHTRLYGTAAAVVTGDGVRKVALPQ